MASKKKKCRVCKQVIRIMIFRGSGYCSDRCRKEEKR